MPYTKSPYPPIPELPPLNVHTLLFERPPGNTIPQDFVVHIDALTGEERTYGQFVERVRDCATALSAPVSQGGLDIRHDSTEKEIIALFSPNCLVRSYFRFYYMLKNPCLPRFRITSSWCTLLCS